MHSTEFLKISNDGLSLYFVLLITFIFIPVLIYSKGYVEEYKNKYSIKYFYLITIIFFISMLGVVISNNSISFLAFWELMSASSFFLVIYEYKKKENLKAGIMYFIMTHISGILLMIMFAIIYKSTGSYNFDDILKNKHLIKYSSQSLIFVFALLGFGAKAGLFPLHAWLPKAHPAAPSNISALMSGVMLKVALYGFIRISFNLISDIPSIYGIAVMIVGSITAIFCILNGVLQKDIKKLLAYSSAENIGLIFATLGLAMVLIKYGFNTAGILALTAALFHTLNHAVFKSLLFTSAGSVLYATGTKNMNELGGLYKKMKFVSYCAFIGTAAISAIPPLNGFASEILILKSFIQGGTGIPRDGIAAIIFVCAIILVLTSGVVMFASVKFFGMTFLGSPRSQKAEITHKVPKSMNIGMGILAAYSVILGVLSPWIVEYISGLSKRITSINQSVKISTFGYEITLAAIVIFTVIIISYLIQKIIVKDSKLEVNDTWGCGFRSFKPYMQYSCDGYTQPVAKLFGGISGYKKESNIKVIISLKQKTVDLIEKYIYGNIVKLINSLSDKIIKIHYGKIQLYISYIFITLILTLIAVIKFI